MSDEQKSGTGTSQGNQVDPTANLKSEFQRKYENTTAELNAMKAQMAQILQTSKPAPNQDDEDFDPYDPQAVKKAVGKQVQAGISEFQKQQQKFLADEQKRAQAISQVVAEYPEFQNPSAEVVQEAKRILATYAPEDQTTATGYKAAMLEAASSLGLAPKSKRSGTGDESFQLGGSRQKADRKQDDEFNPIVKGWMEVLQEHTNVDFSKKETKERIKQRQDRRFGGRK